MPTNGYIPLPDSADLLPTPTLRQHLHSSKTYIFLLNVIKSGCLGALVGLSIDATIITKEVRMMVMQGVMAFFGGVGSSAGDFEIQMIKGGGLTEWQGFELGVTIFYFLCFISSIILIFSKPTSLTTRILSPPLHILLFLAWVYYSVIDIYPYITFHSHPDSPTHLPNPIVWSRFILLSVSAVFVPMTIPRHYIPVDSKDPGIPHPEQTTPIFSFIFYFFMDSIIWKSFRNPNIPYEELPTIADYDKASWLSATQLGKLHPIRRQELGLPKRHLFLGMVSVFWKPYLIMAFMITIRALMEFASPLGINRLLTYLQSDGEGAEIRPWFWIIWLFLGPTLSSIAWQFYIFTSTRNLVRVESLFTQLLFSHSLRIKMINSSEDGVPDTPSAAGGLGAQTPAIHIEDTLNEVEQAGTIQAVISENHLNPSDADSVKKDSSKKDGKKKASTAAPATEEKEKASSLVGRINTLMSSDIDNITDGRDIMATMLYAPLQIGIGAVFLYQILSWSALVGLLITVITLPIPGYLAKIMNKVQGDLMKATDARVQAITEAINTLRMVKLFAWEKKIAERIAEKRDIELKSLKRKNLTQTVIGTINWVLPIATMVVSYALFTGVQKRTLTAAQVFSSITVFDMLRHQMYMLTGQVTSFIQAKVSLDRMQDFLTTTELLDSLKEETPAQALTRFNASAREDSIYFKNAVFSWSSSENTGATTSQRKFKLKIDDLEFPAGQTTLVAGKTSAGKTSLLMALLGEMTFLPSEVDSSFNLPRSGGVAYAAQEAWVMADTVKGNILFGSEYNEERYKKVIHQCALQRDLDLFDAGDETELGEKGLNASGGQKARISLARAVYSSASIILLDDILSALDITTCKWIIDNCFKGDLLKGRTVILVTHHVSLASPISDYMVHLALDGSIDYQGPPDKGSSFKDDDDDDSEKTEIEDKVDETKEGEQAEEGDKSAEEAAKIAKGKLVVAEEKSEGRVSRKSLLGFFSSSGSPIFWVGYFLVILAGEILFALCNYWLGFWSQAYAKTDDPSTVSITYYLGVYVGLMLLQIASYDTSMLMWLFGALRASKKLHIQLAHHILHAPMRFLDKTPTGRIIARFTKDFRALDGPFIQGFQALSELTVTLALKFVLLVSLVPIFAPIAFFIAILGAALGEIYLRSQLSVKREMSNAKSPVINTFAAATTGLISIRAYGAEEYFQSQLRERADKYTRCATTFYNLNRWITIRIDMLGGIFAASLGALLFYGGSKVVTPLLVGFMLNQAVSFSEVLLWWVRMLNDFEVQGNAIERINDYLVIDQEPAPTAKGTPPASWPTSGEIIVSNLKARYSVDGPLVLDDISLTVKSGSRVGIVGRTGSGKSSFTLALLRMIPTEGSISIAGLDSSVVNLESLRSQITIIPQDPVLLSGTLRFNIDPFDEHDDWELNEALKSSGLEMSGGVAGGAGDATPTILTLDTGISSGGGNLSQGQRQLVALARALVRGSKILVLDEATASVDHATDALVQQAIRSLHDVTILTIAHRLSTIMDYDRVMVLGAGKLLEYDTPHALLKQDEGYLRALVNDSADRAELEKLADTTEHK